MSATTADFARHPLRLFQGAPLARRLVIGMEALLASSAAVAGLMMVLRTDGAWLGMSVELLKRSPFASFLVPGLLLSLVVGGSNVFALMLTVLRSDFARLASFVAGATAAIFAAVEVTMIPFSELQPLVMAIGAVVMALSLAPARQR